MKNVEDYKFCLWAYRNRDGKATKIPFNPGTGGRAKSNDPQTFGSYDEASRMLKQYQWKYSGIGIGLFGDLVGIDIDHCIDSNGVMSAVACDIVSAVDSYTEYSPSGTGIHILCRAPGLLYDKSRYYLKRSDLGLEIYVAGKTNRYFTMTEKPVKDSAENICVRTGEVMTVLNKYMLRNKEADSKQIRAARGEIISLNDVEVISRMLSAANSDKAASLWAGEYEPYFRSQSEADLSLCNTLAFWTRKDPEQMDRLFRMSGLMRPKWDETRPGKGTYGKMTIEKAIESCGKIWNEQN